MAKVSFENMKNMYWMLHKKSERWEALAEVEHTIKKDRLYLLLMDTARNNEFNTRDQAIIQRIVEKRHLYGEAVRDFMVGWSRKAYLALPDEFCVYRGGIDEVWWTPDRAKAEWDAANVGGKLVKGRVRRFDVTGVKTKSAKDNAVAELLIMPGVVRDVVVEKVGEPKVVAKLEREWSDKDLVWIWIKGRLTVGQSKEDALRSLKEVIGEMRKAGFRKRPERLEAAIKEVEQEDE